MKIVNLEVFRSLPDGTVFSKYNPCIIDGLRIKVETWECDFLYQDLVANIDADSTEDFMEKLFLTEEKGAAMRLDFDCSERDGLYETDQLFAIYEKEDVEGLIARLQQALADSKL